jgi:hypothetical protein
LDAFLTLLREHKLTVDNVERIVVRLPEDGARVVSPQRGVCNSSPIER